MNQKKYWILTSLATFILLPVWLNGSLFLLGSTLESPWWLPLAALPLLALPYAIYRFGKKAALPDTFLSRYGPFIAPILFTLVAWLIIAFLNGGDFSDGSLGLLVFLPFFVFLFFVIFLETYWLLPIFSIAAYLFFLACFAVGTWRGKRFKTQHNTTALFALALILALVFAALAQRYMHYRDVLVSSWNSDHPSHTEHIEHDVSRFSGKVRLDGVDVVTPKTPPSLQIDRDYPKLDGAVALIPIYTAAANAIYQTNTERTDAGAPRARIEAVAFSRTSPAAYNALLDGQADMIFAGAPSEEQVKEAAKKGITYTLTPIAREAFVFLVNDHNPVISLSDKQIRNIYSGKINNWKEVGGTPGRILAFQRNKGSGSQSAMLRIMGETPMRKPLKVEYAREMGGLIRSVAEYRNEDHAIGYSFRYYATVMNTIPGLRLLEVNNIAPTVENIRNRSYPFIGDICMVTARPLSENTQKLHDWFLSDEGQQLIEDVGYVPVRGDPRRIETSDHGLN